MRRKRLLADMFYKFAELHRQALLTLWGPVSIETETVWIQLTFFFPTNELQSILTPWLTIDTSSLCSFWNQSTISLNVGSFVNLKRSQSVHSVVPYLFLGAAIGSENPKNGKAMLTNPFL